jgi:hypothetical protein
MNGTAACARTDADAVTGCSVTGAA